MVDRLKAILSLPNAQCREYLMQNLLALGYQILTGPDGSWLFAVPTGDKAIPVLLCAHWDTVRKTHGKGADEPVVLFEEHAKIENSNGILGADDRAGCQLILEVAATYTVKPFILFTDFEECGRKGMHSFIKSNVYREYEKFIYLVVSVDRQGHNEAVWYSKKPSGKLEYILDKCGFDVHQGYAYTDGELIAKALNLEFINLSYGGYRPHSADEFLLRDSYEGAYQRITTFLEFINKPFYDTGEVIPSEDTVIDAEVVEEYDIPAPVCEVCGRTHKVASYYPWAQAWLCVACRNRIVAQAPKITAESVEQAKLVLKAEQDRSRQANLKHNAPKHPEFPCCPKCGSNKHVVWNAINAGFVCNECRDKWYKGSVDFDGIFWVLSKDGGMLRLFRPKSNQIMVLSGSGVHVQLVWSGPPNKCTFVKVCSFCGVVEPQMHEVEVEFNNVRHKLNACTTCAADLCDLVVGIDAPF